MKQIKIGFAGAITPEQMMTIGQKMHENAVKNAIQEGSDPIKLTLMQTSPYIFYNMNQIKDIVGLDIFAIVTNERDRHPETATILRSKDMTIEDGGTVIVGPIGMVATLLRVEGIV